MRTRITFFIVSLLVFVTTFSGFSGDNIVNKKDFSACYESNTAYQYIQYGPSLTSPLSAINESFEGTTFPPAGWIKINVATGASGWYRVLAGVAPVPGFSGGSITVPSGGGNAVAFCNHVTGGISTNDQWLITPLLTNITASGSLSFWLRKYGTFIDHMDIKISTTTPTVAAMNVTVANLNFTASDSGWVHYTYPIGTLVSSGSNIYIGFRQWVTNAIYDGSSFSLDLVSAVDMSGIQGNNEIPERFSLMQNYPNPFNPATTIEYCLPKKEFTNLSVYNTLGEEVAVLVNEIKNAGFYKVNFDASELPSGVYIYRLTAGEFTQTQKMTLIK
ncbi:MAG: T9SS C-terminal target domain-containing protein [Ignavibacteriae bacterium]|nr:MAG: T9SS C-terminal target domain-containing protein [Ignavibacteriota bacterium]